MLESLSTEQLEFIKGIERYKNEKKKLFLTWSEVLNILKGLGYEKVASKGNHHLQTPAALNESGSPKPDRLARSIEACKTGIVAKTTR